MSDLYVETLSDGTWVVLGEHVTLEKAKELMQKEDPGAIVTDIRHRWVRYEYIKEEDVIENDFEYAADGKRPRWWVFHDSEKRPKGITKKATELWVDYNAV